MAESIKHEIRRFQDMDSLSRALAEEVVKTARKAVEEKGRFSLALAGGNTPRTLYRLLATEYSDKIPWSSTHLFWSDERYVSKDDPDSNYKMAYQSLISKLSIPPQNTHPIPTKMANPEKDASSYEEYLRGFFKISKSDTTFDLILLGMGEDGHTASLFPGDSVLDDEEKWVKPIVAPSTYKTHQRITLTLPLINRAEKVFFLVSGVKKKAVVKAIFKDPEASSRVYPAAMVSPKGQILWFVDKEAF